MSDYTYIFYHVPQDGDTDQYPNCFMLRKPRKSVTVSDIHDNFPLPGQYYFRFKQALGKSFVWIDVPDISDTAPAVGGEIRMKVARLSAYGAGAPGASAAAARTPGAAAATRGTLPTASPVDTARAAAATRGKQVADTAGVPAREPVAPPLAANGGSSTPVGRGTPAAADDGRRGSSQETAPVAPENKRRTSTDRLFEFLGSGTPGSPSDDGDNPLSLGSSEPVSAASSGDVFAQHGSGPTITASASATFAGSAPSTTTAAPVGAMGGMSGGMGGSMGGPMGSMGRGMGMGGGVAPGGMSGPMGGPMAGMGRGMVMGGGAAPGGMGARGPAPAAGRGRGGNILESGLDVFGSM